MTVRPFQPSDEAILREIHARHDFPFPEHIQDFSVVVDDLGCPIMAAGYKLVPEVTLLCAQGGAVHPLVKMQAISLLHEKLRNKLGANYTEAHAFLEPNSEKAFGRHLQRLFNWRETWKCFVVEIGGRKSQKV